MIYSYSERARAGVFGRRVRQKEAELAREARRARHRVQGGHGLHACAPPHQPGRRPARGLASSLVILQEVRVHVLLDYLEVSVKTCLYCI